MEATRTLAVQISEELFQKMKKFLKDNRITQKEFIINLIEHALDQE